MRWEATSGTKQITSPSHHRQPRQMSRPQTLLRRGNTVQIPDQSLKIASTCCSKSSWQCHFFAWPHKTLPLKHEMLLTALQPSFQHSHDSTVTTFAATDANLHIAVLHIQLSDFHVNSPRKPFITSYKQPLKFRSSRSMKKYRTLLSILVPGSTRLPVRPVGSWISRTPPWNPLPLPGENYRSIGGSVSTKCLTSCSEHKAFQFHEPGWLVVWHPPMSWSKAESSPTAQSQSKWSW